MEDPLGRIAFDAAAVERNAPVVAGVLKVLGNDRRLMILCELARRGEVSVTALSEAAGLSQSALSQHLGKLRDAGLVGFRREAQTLWYFIADPRIEPLMANLYELYCKPSRTRSR
jgi:ArsR family transcriptional regulator, virulence genes transcriptional regulator